MKKYTIILFLLFALSLVGCNEMNSGKIKNGKTDYVEQTKVLEIDYSGIDSDIPDIVVDISDCLQIRDTSIRNNQDAIYLASEIIDNLHSNGRFKGYSLSTIVHSIKDDIWRFDYSNMTDSSDVDGGNLCVAFYGNGSLLMAWLEE